MTKTRASKGFISKPAEFNNIPAAQRNDWLDRARYSFVTPMDSFKEIYSTILRALWPEGHGIPGPILSEDEVRAAVDEPRISQGKKLYKDVFRRLRELQGEEGFKCIIKEGRRYQLQNLAQGPKRVPREKPSRKIWNEIKRKYDYRCANCGNQEPDVKLSPDHRVPRMRDGSNDPTNIQPLCKQCNNIKSSTCHNCTLDCYTCSWAFPENYKPIVIGDDNKELLRREAERESMHQSDLTNRILRDYFNRRR